MKAKITLILLFICFIAEAQQVSSDNRIIVIGQATVKAPADRILFHVNMNAVDTLSINNVYKKHQSAESKMVKLLKELNIPQDQINYTLFSLQHERDYETKEWFFIGSQQVNFKVDSVHKYADIQGQLIQGGFSDFRANFISSELDKYKSNAIEEAIISAKQKAAVMAQASDRRIKRIIRVADTEDSDPILESYRYNISAAAVGAPDNSLTEISQTIPVTATVKVVFELK